MRPLKYKAACLLLKIKRDLFGRILPCSISMGKGKFEFALTSVVDDSLPADAGAAPVAVVADGCLAAGTECLISTGGAGACLSDGIFDKVARA